jgi:hypothetical protein
MSRDEPSFLIAIGECDELARSSSMILNVRTQSKFSSKVRMKRSAIPFPSVNSDGAQTRPNFAIAFTVLSNRGDGRSRCSVCGPRPALLSRSLTFLTQSDLSGQGRSLGRVVWGDHGIISR